MKRCASHFIGRALIAALVASVFPVNAILAKETADTHPVASKKTHENLTIAILDFNASSANNKEIGPQISDLLGANLTGIDGFALIERPTLSHVLQEHELTLTGIVNTDQAIQVGKLVGAKILVTGKAFVQGPDLYITAKLIGTETSRVEGIYVKADKDADVGNLLLKLSEKIATRLREAGPKLVAQEGRTPDPLPDLKKSLAGRTLPKVAIHLKEQHISPAPAVQVDPSAQTELVKILTDAGFVVIDGDEKQEVEAGVAVIISGEGLSEFAARIGSLVSCSARVEVKMLDRKSKEVLLSTGATARAVDLSEALAGKTALQKAAHLLGIEVLRRFDATVQPLKGDAPKSTKKEKAKSPTE